MKYKLSIKELEYVYDFIIMNGNMIAERIGIDQYMQASSVICFDYLRPQVIEDQIYDYTYEYGSLAENIRKILDIYAESVA